MLDYGKVSVKRLGLPRCDVPGIRHYEAIRQETIRLLRKERERRKLSKYAVAQRSGVSESMLSRKTFRSVAAIAEAVSELSSHAPQTMTV